VLGRTSLDLGIWRDPADQDKFIALTLAKGKLREYELPLKTKDGRPIVVSLNADTIELGGKPHLLSAFADITERRAAQEALRTSEAWSRSLIENALELVLVVDKDIRVKYYGPGGQRITGRGPEERLGRPALDVVHPDDVPRVRRTGLRLLRKRGGSRNLRFRVRHKSGDWRTLEAVFTNLLHDPAIEGVVINAIDVEERVQAEDALKRIEEEHRRNLVWYRALIENAHDVVIVLDERALFKYVSPAYERLTGWKPEDRLGRSPFMDIHPEDSAAVESALKDLLVEPGRSRSVRHRVRRKDGSWMLIEAVGTNLLHVPAIRGIVVNAREI
jgi:PAS domain S-box-containing protein